MRKWILVIVLLLAAIITAFTIFAVTGVIDAPALFWNLGMKIGWIEPHLKVYAIGQDAEQWIAGSWMNWRRKPGSWRSGRPPSAMNRSSWSREGCSSMHGGQYQCGVGEARQGAGTAQKRSDSGRPLYRDGA